MKVTIGMLLLNQILVVHIKNMLSKTLKILSVIVIIISLIIIGTITYQQRASLVNGSIKTGKAIVDFFPFSKNNSMPSWHSQTSSTSSDQTLTTNSIINKTLFEKITNEQIARADILDLPNASSTLIFIDKENGNIFQVKKGKEKERISNITISNVFDAYFGLDKNKNIRAIIRYVDNDDLKSISLNINNNSPFSTSSDPSLRIIKSELSPNIIDFAVSPKKDKLFYVENLGNKIVTYTSDFDLKNKKIIKVIPFKDWIISWVNENVVVFQTKTSSDINGAVYFLNLKDKSFSRMGNGILGLTSLVSPDNNKIIYSNSLNNSFNSTLRNFDLNKAYNLNPKILPEKCLWLKNNLSFVCAVPKMISKANYPDDWYQGKIKFSDTLWIYYVDGGKNHQLYDPNIDDYDVDLLPQTTDKFNNFYFIDKKSSILYRFNGEFVFDE